MQMNLCARAEDDLHFPERPVVEQGFPVSRLSKIISQEDKISRKPVKGLCLVSNSAGQFAHLRM